MYGKSQLMAGYDDTYLEFAEKEDRLSSVGRNMCEGYPELS